MYNQRAHQDQKLERTSERSSCTINDAVTTADERGGAHSATRAGTSLGRRVVLG
jgi:hypothetical protein